MATFQDKPLSTDLISVSQGDLQGNFEYLQGSLDKDHQCVFGDTPATPGEGRHRSVGLIDNGVLTFPTGDDVDSFWYSTGGNTFWSNTTVGPVQMTNASVPLAASSGNSFLPGGLLIQWGVSALTGVATTITYPVAFTTGYVVTGSLSALGASFAVTTIGNNNFTVTGASSLAGIDFIWTAIGAK